MAIFMILSHSDARKPVAEFFQFCNGLDLDGETLLLVKRGDSPVLNRLRDEIERNHPQITLLDTPHFYDTNVFNQCEQMGCIMETLDIWRDVHPSIVTIPMMWDYKIPYGIVYAKKPAAPMQTVVTMLRSRLITAGVS